jgi:hypothetical protein
MTKSPFLFEECLTEEELRRLGLLALRWSHIEHILGNCLRRRLGMSEDDAVMIIFPMPLERILHLLQQIADERPLDKVASPYYEEVRAIMKAIQYVRNTVIHAILIEDDTGASRQFELRSKRRFLSVEEALACESVTNYAATAVIEFRKSLGEKGGAEPQPLPDRPTLPGFLAKKFPDLLQKGWVAQQ